MGKRKADQPNSDMPEATDSAPDTIAAPVGTEAPLLDAIARAEAAPSPEPATVAAIDAPAIASGLTPDITPAVTPPTLTLVEAPKLETPKLEPLKIDAPKIEMTTAAPPALDDVRPGASEAPAAAATHVTELPAWTRVRRLMPFAASIAIAAAAGAMAGSLATAGLNALWAGAPAATQTADAKPLHDTIARINAELAALKSTIDNSGKTANSQLTKLGDRFDRLERAQSEPVAKLAKLAEAVDRIEHRAPAAQAAAAHDVTGSIAAPTLAAPATQPTVDPAKLPPGPPVLDGWRVRSVYNGAALIQGRMGAVIEVEPGDNLPGLGRIETIRRQDGRWVVVTSKGLILAR